MEGRWTAAVFLNCFSTIFFLRRGHALNLELTDWLASEHGLPASAPPLPSELGFVVCWLAYFLQGGGGFDLRFSSFIN